ncbi:MAG: IS4 family transposase [Luteolibacter sp.]
MTKQAYLTDFPLHILGTSKRRFQAAIRARRAALIRSSLSGYGVLFGDILPSSFLSSIDPTKRQRCYGHIPVFWAWLAQILESNSSCQRAVCLIQNWSRSSGRAVPSSDTSSYCQGRLRVEISFLQSIHERIAAKLSEHIREKDLWNGLTLKAVDGSSVHLMDTEANQQAYPQSSSQKKGCGSPYFGMVGLLNLSHGGWEQIKTCPMSTHEINPAVELTQTLEANDLLMGDRAFGSYELIARCMQRGAHVLMRLHQAREGALDWNHGKKISRHERIVVWRRPYRPAGSHARRDQWKELPETLELRLIKLSYQGRGGRKATLILVTTLLDYRKFNGIELADLYARRWDIELKLRDLKTTMNMEFLAVKSPDMAHKTLLMGMIANNLIRYMMQSAARMAGEPVWQMSFKGTLDLIVSSHESFRPYAGSPTKKKTEFNALLKICTTKRINVRPFRSEPRAVKRRPKNHPLLSAPRHEYEEVFHRSRYFRQSA